jgi:hypothetical protein
MRKIKSRIYQKVRLHIPDFSFSIDFSEFLLDHIPPFIYFDRWSVQPFNGQLKRFQTISWICDAFEPTHAIETGTFLGSSTPYLSALVSEKTYSIEIDRKTAKKANDRFQKNHAKQNIELIVGDSAKEISKVLKLIDPKKSKVIAYLDAHWYDAIPTTEEIQSLNKWGGAWIAIIDDFKVDFDDGYGFDQYENTIIGKKIIPQIKDAALYVPYGQSEKETGRRKGTGYLFSKKAQRIVKPNLKKNLLKMLAKF